MKIKNDNIINGYKFSKDFIYFLNKNNIYKEYKYNYEYLRNKSFSSFMPEAKLIITAFDWATSNEGHEFWIKMHNKWINYIESET